MIGRNGETVRVSCEKTRTGLLIRLAEESALRASFLVNTQAWLVNVKQTLTKPFTNDFSNLLYTRQNNLGDANDTVSRVRDECNLNSHYYTFRFLNLLFTFPALIFILS